MNYFDYIKTGIVAVSIGSAPIVFAQQSSRTLRDVVADISGILGDAVMPLLFIFALSWFIWGVVEFIGSADNKEKRTKGRVRMLWGIIALFAMVSFLGLTSIFTETFFNQSPTLPQLYENTTQ